MRFLGIIADQARRLESLVGDLLNLRTLEEAGLELQLEEVDLREVLGEQAAAFESQLARPRAPARASGEPLLLRADRRRVGQVVATCSRTRSSTRRTAAPSRSGPPGATAASSSPSPTRGSASRKRAGTTSSCRSSASAREAKPDGTGLGLAISRRIVRRHGGELDFESTARQGLHLFLRAPARAAGMRSRRLQRWASLSPPVSGYGNCCANACAMTSYPSVFAWMSGPCGGDAQIHVHWHSRRTSSGVPSTSVVSVT